MTKSASKPKSTEDFVNVITEFIDLDLTDYFTDEKKSAELVQWLMDDWGLKKYQANIIIRRISPFVLARMGEIGGIVGESVKKKIHVFFNKFDWYFNLTQKLLDLLKCKNEHTIENALALKRPRESALQSIVNNNELWLTLKPEFQALIQLLLGQKELLKDLDFLKQQLTDDVQRIIQELSFRLDLVSPSLSLSLIDKQNKSFANWLTYTHQQAPLVGRKKSLKQLDQFFNQDEKFSWWAITGAGGMGKSRLAFDAIQKYENKGGWEVGFLSKHKLHDPDALSHWQQTKPTIIVIDYAGDSADAIDHWLGYFIQHQQTLAFPVRLLLLERYSKDQDWWTKKLLQQGTSQAELRQKTLFNSTPHELSPLKEKHQKALLQQFLDALSSAVDLSEADERFWKHVEKLTVNGRPLFLGMIATAIYEKGTEFIRDWSQKELLQNILSHDEKNWSMYFDQNDLLKKSDLYNLFALSTMVSGLNPEYLSDKKQKKLIQGLIKCEILPNDKARTSLDDYLSIIQKMAGNAKGHLQPDILAEYFVLQHWRALKPTQKDALVLAFKLFPVATSEFFKRATLDFLDDKTTHHWWLSLQTHSKKKDQTTVNNLAFSIMGQLSLAGQSPLILEQWLPILCDSKDKKTRARALNLKGLQNRNLGEISRALILYKQAKKLFIKLKDKSGEGSTLNNISQIFKVRGDYETALSYLKQSLEIVQEIGDKSGEGTTLSNISQIFKARGDYETALSYLKQSLEIQQEIGDNAGMCATLFNMGHIQLQNKHQEKALKTWGQVYALAKPMKLAQALDALEGLAEQLGLPKGLESWEVYVPNNNEVG